HGRRRHPHAGGSGIPVGHHVRRGGGPGRRHRAAAHRSPHGKRPVLRGPGQRPVHPGHAGVRRQERLPHHQPELHAAGQNLVLVPRPRHLHPHGHPHRRRDRKSTRLNSSHVKISYAVFCLKKKKINSTRHTSNDV